MRLVLVASLLVATTAQASPQRAWEAARDNLPASAKMVLGVNVEGAMASSLSIFAPPLVASTGAKAVFDRVQSTCKLDPIKAIDSLVIVEGAKTGVGAYYLSLDDRDGLDKASVTACLTKLELDAKVATAWIGTDVLVIAAAPADKAMLATYTSGKGAFAKSALGKLVAKTNTNATMWAASVNPRAVQGKKMKQGFGGFDIANGTLTATIAMTFASPAEAKTVEKLANDQIIALLASGQLDAIVMEMLNKVSITTKVAELQIVGSIPEKQILPLIQAITTSSAPAPGAIR